MTLVQEYKDAYRKLRTGELSYNGVTSRSLYTKAENIAIDVKYYRSLDDRVIETAQERLRAYKQGEIFKLGIINKEQPWRGCVRRCYYRYNHNRRLP